MRPNMCDNHRRDSDDIRTAEIIRRNEMQRRNAREWVKRSNAAWLTGHYDVAANCIAQAARELATVR